MIERTMLGADRVMTQQAVIERDHATVDEYGASAGVDWQPLATVPCFMWWGTGAIITRMGARHDRPEELVDLESGGMILPEGTDITPRDRVQNVLDETGSVLHDGPFEVLAVGPFEGLTEALLRRVT